MLSGFVLSLSFFKHWSVDALVLQRFTALCETDAAGPGSTILAYALLRGGLLYIHQAKDVVGTDVLGEFWNFTPHFFDALYQGVYTSCLPTPIIRTPYIIRCFGPCIMSFSARS